MAKLTKQQWQAAKQRWQRNEKLSYEGLAKSIGVSKPAVIQYAHRHDWKRGNVSGNKNVSVSGLKTVKPKPEIDAANQQEVVKKKWGHGEATLYKPEYDEIAYKFCLLGATDKQMGEFFQVTETTVNNWKLKHPSFFESIRGGKIKADADMAKSFYKRGLGYQTTEIRTKQVLSNDPDSEELITVEVVETVKDVPPETSAAFLWLKNRRPQDWRDKQETENVLQLDAETLKFLAGEFQAKMEASHRLMMQLRLERGIIEGDYQAL